MAMLLQELPAKTRWLRSRHALRHRSLDEITTGKVPRTELRQPGKSSVNYMSA